MSILLTRWRPRSRDRRALVHLLAGNEWPFHTRPVQMREDVHAAVSAGVFHGATTRTFWIDHTSHGRIGLVRLHDLPEAPMLDLRLQEDARGRGLGVPVLREVTRFVFATFPAVHRFEGTTRQDNMAMRKTFERCGWAKECHYRQAWPTADGRLLDAVGYAILRSDVESGAVTPVNWNDMG